MKMNSRMYVLFPMLVAASLAWGFTTRGWSLVGLISDFIGVFILGYHETVRAGPALIKYWARADGGARLWADIKKEPLVAKIPLWIAAKFGSEDLMDMNQEAAIESYPIKAWGFFLLFIGFFFQAVGYLK